MRCALLEITSLMCVAWFWWGIVLERTFRLFSIPIPCTISWFLRCTISNCLTRKNWNWHVLHLNMDGGLVQHVPLHCQHFLSFLYNQCENIKGKNLKVPLYEGRLFVATLMHINTTSTCHHVVGTHLWRRVTDHAKRDARYWEWQHNVSLEITQQPYGGILQSRMILSVSRKACPWSMRGTFENRTMRDYAIEKPVLVRIVNMKHVTL